MTGRQFRIGLLGLTQLERLTVTSVCSLTQSRTRGFEVLQPERCAEADIMLVDADDECALQLWNASPVRRSGQPALMISRDPQALNAYPYSLSRAGFAARLVRRLDQITVQEFRYFRSMTIGGDHAATGEFARTGRREIDARDIGTGAYQQFSNTSIEDTAPYPQLRMNAPAPGAFESSGMVTGINPGLHALPRALVIDDCLVVQAKMRALLSMHGLTSDLVDNAEQGVELMRTNRYAIVFLDIVLPGMDGFTACRQMKAIDRTFTPIVMLSSRGSPIDRMRGHMAGCQRYLTKPIAIDTLQKVLCDFIPAETLTMAAASVSGAHRALPVLTDALAVSDSTVLARQR
jgi:twitching motility two-component system response regulator PilG